jgi:hypothetical protein
MNVCREFIKRFLAAERFTWTQTIITGIFLHAVSSKDIFYLKVTLVPFLFHMLDVTITMRDHRSLRLQETCHNIIYYTAISALICGITIFPIIDIFMIKSYIVYALVSLTTVYIASIYMNSRDINIHIRVYNIAKNIINYTLFTVVIINVLRAIFYILMRKANLYPQFS